MTNVAADDLAKLKLERGQCKAKVTRFETYLNSVRADQIFQLESRLNDISKLLDIFNEIQLRIEILEPGELETDERQNFEDKYYNVISIAMQKICDFKTHSAQAQQSGTPTSNNSFKSNVKLPTMQLPTFDGNYEQWEHFRDMFMALVDQDSSIDNIRKFYYLSTALTGAAAKVIKSITVTSDNYAVAWQLLKDRFEDKDIITRNHVKAIVEMKQVSGDLQNSLREFTDNLQVHIRSLESLGEPVDQWSSILNYIIWKKLDTDTQDEWEEFLVSKKVKRPDHATFIKFLVERCKFLEKKDKSNSNEINRVFKQNKVIENREKCNPSKFQFHKKPSVSHFAGKRERDTLCQHCRGEHYIYSCEKLRGLPVTARLAEVKRLNLCINCLRSNHRSNECIARGCKKCGKKHNTMLHFENANNSVENDLKTQRTNQGASTSATSVANDTSNIAIEENRKCSLVCSKREKQILLSTAIVSIRDIHGHWHFCRVLLDSGSQPNFISKSLCSLLQLKTSKTNIPVLGVGESATNVLNSTRTQIKSLQENFSIDLSFLILEKITENLPLNHFNKSTLEIPSDIVLADNAFNVSEKIDLLLGAEIFYSLLKTDQIKLGPGLPILQSTVLGWIVSGPLPRNIVTNNKKICNIAINDLNFDLERFWNIEEIGDKPDLSLEERTCENKFISTTIRDDTGRFIVSLPFKENNVVFGDSLDNALKRLYAMERKFMRDPVFREKYIDFMTEYEALGHMTKIDPSEFYSHSGCVFYLPHHGVLNENSSTTKLRVVFDGSCKSSNGLSLNEVLLVGPTLQDDLFSILTRFRKHNFVITADIAKMYRQVKIKEIDRDYQRIVWRKTTEEPIGHYRLNTVTYGTSSASYLAIRSLQQVGFDMDKQNPITAETVLSDFYVDDLLSGSTTIDGAITLKSNLIDTLNSYGFPLRKWAANDKDILTGSVLGETDNYQILDSETKKTLGMWWQACSDTFIFKVHIENATTNITKRIILSSTAKLFDPLGLLSPVILQAKIILQRLWQLKIGWDDPLPIEFTQLWLNFVQSVSEIENIIIPRHVIDRDPLRIELHGFSDASEMAYGACLYIKSVKRDNTTKIALLCSKSRVAPLKALSLPRLELCGAVLLVRLYKKVIKAMKHQFDEIYFWTDSSIVLSWLKAPPNSWKVFVANRVSEIQRHTDVKQWAHVSSVDNPADLVSRGIKPNRLYENQLWWHGPKWLSLERELWPKSAVNCSDAPEKRKRKIISLSVVSHNFSIFERYSTLHKLKRIVALCFRFYNNCRCAAVNRQSGLITLNEMDDAFKVLLKLGQADAFKDELNVLSNNDSVSKVSRLRSLNPFIDSDQLIRVGGRIRNSELPSEVKHQIILPAKHRLTKLIILNEHYRHIHAGAQAILNSLRQSFWPIDGRATIRDVLRKCLICRRVKPLTVKRQMGNLPRDRVTPNRPFFISGVDFAGPFSIKDGKLRNRSIIKAYLCLFICFSTKAVHLETVSDLSSHAFLSALKRFISRRGICRVLYSDNGTNFVGANNLLQSIQIENFLLENRIEWKFIPPQSPHQGGLWEASIKIAKFHAKRVIGDIHLTFEDLATLFCQIEAIMNSRPITPLSTDPNDLSALTPGHFLIGSPLLALPQTDFTSVPPNRLKHYERLQQIVQHFWRRWSREYLLALQQRTKWQRSNSTPLNLGDLVVLIDENAAPQDWKMGRILELHPGNDGVARVATIKLSTGSTKRAVQKICKLPLEDPLC